MTNPGSTSSSGASRRAAKHLEGLYGTVIAVGLGVAVVSTLRSDAERLDVAWDHMPLLAAFLIVLVPFYQGALLHLDAKYDRLTNRGHPTIVLLVDFVGLFVEAVVIVALAASVGDVRSFLAALCVLLGVDVVWATSAWLLQRDSGQLRGWIQINLVTLLAICLGFLIGLWVDYPDSWLIAVALAVAAFRSGIDYWINWDFYGGVPPAPGSQPARAADV
jgi:hypothetical protein